MNKNCLLLCISLLFCSFIYGQSDDKIYTIVEQQPEYPEGQAALFKYLGNNIKITQDTLEFDCSNILIKFIVEKDGSAIYESCKFYGCKSPCPVETMKKLIEDMPKWKAGRQNGQTVRVAYSLSVKVRIE